MKNNIEEVIEKHFKDEKVIWFDYKDNIKANYSIERRGLSCIKQFGKFEICLVSEDEEPILLCTLDRDEGDKLLNILKIMWY